MERDKEFEEKLDRWIEAHRDELFRDISSVVAVRSVSEKGADGYPYGKGCHDVLAEAERIASSYGFECRNPEDREVIPCRHLKAVIIPAIQERPEGLQIRNILSNAGYRHSELS